MTPTHYKGIPLEFWSNKEMLQDLTEEEMIELHALMYSKIIDEVEPYVKKSQLIEASVIIQHIKDNI